MPFLQEFTVSSILSHFVILILFLSSLVLFKLAKQKTIILGFATIFLAIHSFIDSILFHLLTNRVWNYISSCFQIYGIILTGFYFIYIIFSDPKIISKFKIITSIFLIFGTFALLYVSQLSPIEKLVHDPLIIIILSIYYLPIAILTLYHISKMLFKMRKLIITTNEMKSTQMNLRFIFYGIFMLSLSSIFSSGIQFDVGKLCIMFGVLFSTIGHYKMGKKENVIIKLHQIDDLQKTLEFTDKKYKSIVENSEELIFQCDLHGRVTFINSSLEKVLGYSKEEVLNKKLYSVIPHKNYQEIDNKFIQIINSNSDNPINIISNAQTKKGQIVWLSSNIVPLKENSGKITSFLGICRNITIEKEYNSQLEETVRQRTQHLELLNSKLSQEIEQREKLENNLRKSEDKYRKLYENMMDGYVFVDMEGNIKEYNEIYRNLLGYSDTEIKSLKYQQITPIKWHEMEENIIKTQISVRGYSDVYEKEYIQKNGNIIPIELRVYLTSSIENNIEGMWGIVRDISTRKNAEKQLHEMLNKAQDGNKAKELFLENMSHELRTPLNSIIGFASTLQNEENLAPHDVFEIGKDIHQSGLHLLKIIENVLHVSTLEKNFETLNLSNFSLIEIIEIIYQNHQNQLIKKKISVSIVNLKNINYIYMDKEKLIIILDNLIDNSIKFSKENDVIRFIINSNGNILSINIEDHGIGIAPYNFDKIFRPFVQLDYEKNKSTQGTGIGLYLTKLLVENLKGTIYFESELDKGTTFFLQFPITKNGI